MKNLLDNNYIKRDDSLFITLDHNYKFSYANNKFLSTDLIRNNQIILNSNLLEKFNQVFAESSLINKLLDYDDISLMRWSSSQPDGRAFPSRFKFCGQLRRLVGIG